MEETEPEEADESHVTANNFGWRVVRLLPRLPTESHSGSGPGYNYSTIGPMEPPDIRTLHAASNSSSSAIDLTGTTAGITYSTPPSPSLEATQGAFSRRRTSWGNRIDAGQDPLRFDLPQASTSNTTPYTVTDDPFFYPQTRSDDPWALNLAHSPSSSHTNVTTRYGTPPVEEAYSTSQGGPSSAALIPPPPLDLETDDEAGLTANMAHSRTDEERWGDRDDTEGNAGVSPRSRRRTVRYSSSPSPLKKTGTAIKHVSKNLRRVSLRVVNLAGAGLESQIRLPDDDNEGRRAKRDDDVDEFPLPDLTQNLPIRGRTLGFLGPNSTVRLACFNFLVYPCVVTRLPMRQ